MRGGWIFFFKINKRDSTFIRDMRVVRHVALILFLFAISGSDHRPDSRFTLIDANGVLFQQSSWSFLQPLQFIYRYGIFSMLKLNYFIQGMLNDFSNIYAFLDEGSSWILLELNHFCHFVHGFSGHKDAPNGF